MAFTPNEQNGKRGGEEELKVGINLRVLIISFRISNGAFRLKYFLINIRKACLKKHQLAARTQCHNSIARNVAPQRLRNTFSGYFAYLNRNPGTLLVQQFSKILAKL